MRIVEARIERADDLRLRTLLGETPERGILVLHTSFDPRTLVASITLQGHRAALGCELDGAWTLAIQRADAPEILDLRDLEAPEPLERILLRVSELAPGEVLVARTPRLPKMLLPQLERRGLEWQTFEEPDCSGLVWMRKPV